MAASLFQDVTTIYEKSYSTKIIRHRLEHPALGQFCVSLQTFYSELDDLATHDYWQKFLIPLKRLQFGLCAAPFSEIYRRNRISTIVDELQYHIRFCPKLYPDLADSAFAILDLLEGLINYPNDPLLEKLLKLTNADQQVAWVIKESRLIPHVEELSDKLKLPKLNIVHPLQLKNRSCYDQIIVVGPSRWFPESLFTAPRASQIDILIFDWVNDRWFPKNVFVSQHGNTNQSTRNYISLEEYETNNRGGDINPETLLTIVDKTSSLSSVLSNDDDWDKYESVEAVCVFLEDDWAVLIEGSEGSKTLVIDPDEDKDNRIVRIPVKAIRSGMFILARTKGHGDYILSVADKIMGTQANKAREYQKHWKELLRNYVRKNDLLKTSIDLLDLGSNLANEINVQNWMSSRSIRTQNYDDFVAIMKLVGLEDQVQEYWAMLKGINRAHLKAGFEIRKLLLEQVKDLNMEVLQKQGKMDFKLSSDDEGRLTAFRVEKILSETLEVSYSRIGQPFKLEDQLWHE